MIRTYSDLRRLASFEDRFEYLKLNGRVGADTFGFDRYLNQRLYASEEWKAARRAVIIRDNGCDLGMEGYEIADKVIIHHMNPLSIEDITELRDSIFDPEFLICVSHRTHEAIHYGDARLLPKMPVDRRPGDTKFW